jgi:N6-adenosine-specific RNA methylase IME4
MTAAPKADNLPFPPAPAEKFRVAAIDCPWHFETRAPVTVKVNDRSPQKHYPTADLAHLKTIPFGDILERNAWVFCWMTGPLLAKGVQVPLAKAWGLEISGMAFGWLKLWDSFDTNLFARTPLLEQDLAVGGGYTTRKNLEFVVLMKRGQPKVARRDIREPIISPRAEHSRKPGEFYRRVEHFCEGPRIDMFGGAERPGWTHWGWGHRQGEAEPYRASATG